MYLSNLLKNFESICEKYSCATNLFISEVLERLYVYWSNFKVIDFFEKKNSI